MDCITWTLFHSIQMNHEQIGILNSIYTYNRSHLFRVNVQSTNIEYPGQFRNFLGREMYKVTLNHVQLYIKSAIRLIIASIMLAYKDSSTTRNIFTSWKSFGNNTFIQYVEISQQISLIRWGWNILNMQQHDYEKVAKEQWSPIWKLCIIGNNVHHHTTGWSTDFYIQTQVV